MINYSQLSATCLVGYLQSHVQRPHVVEYSYLLCTVGHFEFAPESGFGVVSNGTMGLLWGRCFFFC